MDKQTAYIEKLSAQIVEWDAQIAQIKDKADSASSAEKDTYSGAIEALKLKRDAAALELQGIGRTSDDEWGDIKSGSENTMGEVRTIIHDAITKIT